MDSVWRQLRQLSNTRPGGLSALERQQYWLSQCLGRNEQTHYGRRYRFSSIDNPADYQRQVPLVTYDELGDWMRRTQQGEEDVLFMGRAIAFEQTGGSTGGSKLIPFSRESLADFREAILPWLADLVESYRIEDGSTYFAISPVCRAERDHARARIDRLEQLLIPGGALPFVFLRTRHHAHLGADGSTPLAPRVHDARKLLAGDDYVLLPAKLRRFSRDCDSIADGWYYRHLIRRCVDQPAGLTAQFLQGLVESLDTDSPWCGLHSYALDARFFYVLQQR